MKITHFLLEIILLMFMPVSSYAQKATWRSSVKHIRKDVYEIEYEVKIPQNYHIYDLGPYDQWQAFPTSFKTTASEGVELLDPVKAHTRPKYIMNGGFRVGTFEKKALFRQKVRLTASSAHLETYIEWMLCTESSCTVPDDSLFLIPIPGDK